MRHFIPEGLYYRDSYGGLRSFYYIKQRFACKVMLWWVNEHWTDIHVHSTEELVESSPLEFLLNTGTHFEVPK